MSNIPTLTQLASEVDYFYEPIPHEYNSTYAFVFLKDGNLRLKVADSTLTAPSFEDAIHFDGFETLELHLIKNNFSLTSLHSMLYQAVLTRAVFHKKKLEQLTEMLGQSAISECEGKWEEFSNGIAKVIRKSNMRIVE